MIKKIKKNENILDLRVDRYKKDIHRHQRSINQEKDHILKIIRKEDQGLESIDLNQEDIRKIEKIKKIRQVKDLMRKRNIDQKIKRDRKIRRKIRLNVTIL